MTETATTGAGTATKAVADEFRTHLMSDAQLEATMEVRHAFDTLLTTVTSRIPPENARYTSLVKTKLEEACFFAVKGIAKN